MKIYTFRRRNSSPDSLIPVNYYQEDRGILSLIILTFCIVDFILFYPLSVFGGDKEKNIVPTEPIVITPSRLREPLSCVSSSLTVITHEEIEDQQAVTAEEVLRNISGIDIHRSGTVGEQTRVRIRGTENNQILILIDGVSVNSTWTGDFDFADLMADNIERIEILRGNQSALYGSEAMGGVINIITGQGKGKQRLSFQTEGGNFGTFRGMGGISGSTKKTDYAFTLSRTGSAGQFKRDAYKNITFSGQAGIKAAELVSLRYTTRYYNSEKELPINFFYDLTPDERVHLFFDENLSLEKKFLLNSVIFRHTPFIWWDYRIKGSIVDDKLIYDDRASPEEPIETIYRLDNSRKVIETQHNIYLFDERDTITVGFEYREDKAEYIKKPEVMIDKMRTDYAYYLQNIFNWKRRFFLTVGFRVDDYSDVGTSTNPKISTSYLFEPVRTKFKGSWGTGFRSPTIQELYTPGPYGNPALRPEKSQHYEFGVEQNLWEGYIEFEATYFHMDFRDLIQKSLVEVDVDNAGKVRVTNVGKAEIWGIEAELKIRPIYDLFLWVNYNYLETRNRNTGEPLPQRPTNRWNIGIEYYPIDRLNLNLNINIVSSQYYDYGFDFIGLDGSFIGRRIGGYEKVDLTATYTLLKNYHSVNKLEIFGKTDNLFDRDYFEVIGFPAQGITFRAGIKGVF